MSIRQTSEELTTGWVMKSILVANKSTPSSTRGQEKVTCRQILVEPITITKFSCIKKVDNLINIHIRKKCKPILHKYLATGFNKASALDFPSTILTPTPFDTWCCPGSTKCQGSPGIGKVSPMNHKGFDSGFVRRMFHF